MSEPLEKVAKGSKDLAHGLRAVRDIKFAYFARTANSSVHSFRAPPDLAPLLPDVLWLYQMAVVVKFIYWPVRSMVVELLEGVLR